LHLTLRAKDGSTHSLKVPMSQLVQGYEGSITDFLIWVTSQLGEQIFPGGVQQKLFCAQKVVELCNAKLSQTEALAVFIKAKVRYKIACLMYDGDKHLGVSADELVKDVIAESKGKLCFLEALAVSCYAVFDRIDPSIDSHSALKQALASNFGSDEQGYDCNVIPFAVGEYGLEYTNPIPIRGIGGIRVYLGKLRTDDGRRVLCKRVRAINEPNQFPVDEYDVFSDGGKLLAKLYVCPYHQRISRKAPKGFTLVDSGI